jgi:hypothetical protein
MPPIRIKLNKEQLGQLEKLIKRKTRKGWKITIQPKDILASSKSPQVNTSERNVAILTTAYNLEEPATVLVSRKVVLQLARHHFPEQVIGNDLGATIRLKQDLPELNETTDEQLVDYAEKLGISPFAVVCIDEEHPDIGIINSDTRESGGKHWTAVYIDHQGKRNFVFDPFGVDPDTRITEQLDEKNPDYETIWNTQEIQNLKEDNCGQQCLRWLHSIHRTTRKKQEMYRYCTTAKTDLAKWWHKMGLPFE